MREFRPMKRFVSFLLIAFTLYWAFTVERATHAAAKSKGQHLVVQAESTSVPDLVKRTQKSSATGLRHIVEKTVILHWERTLTWSPLPGSFAVTRYMRDCFYTFVSIHAP